MAYDEDSTTSVGSVGPGRPKSHSAASTQVIDAGEPARDPALGPPSPGASHDGALSAGQAVGRYLVLQVLGRGGMSIVYIAYDPELDRRVALKVMRPDTGEPSQQAQARLLREAQAMARLAHPNVVRVYDVGVVGDRVYMAMELVEGTTLRKWTRQTARSWRAVVDVLVRAGRGLAAAHGAGLVHLDVTPRNILVGDERRVLVMDFGLARAPVPVESNAPPGGEWVSVLGNEVTHTGIVMGTPGYMAPEQLEGATPDARTDQFSFCVTAWEALFGQRPYPGRTMEDYSHALAEARIAEPPVGPRVPLRLRRLLERGLSVDPARRWPTMEGLLDAMADDPSRRWLRRLGLLGVLGALSLGAWSVGRGQTDPCAHVTAQLDGIWDEPRRDAVRQRLEAAAAPAESTAEVVGLLDAYAVEWIEEATDTCRATRGAERQSAEELDLRNYCLRHHLRAFQAIPELILEADTEPSAQWRDAIFGLPRVTECRDAEEVQHSMAPPADPRLRESEERIGRYIAKASALSDAGNLAAAIEVARPALEAAEAARHRPMIASLQLLLAQALAQLEQIDEAERLAFQGLWTADAEGLYGLRLEAYVELMYILGVLQGRTEEALHLGQWGLELERAVLHDPMMRAQLLAGLGSVLATAGRAEEACRRYRESLEIRRAQGGPRDLDLGLVLNGLGGALLTIGEPAQALVQLEESHALLRAHYGPRHNATLVALENIGTALHALERYEEALARVEQAIAMSLEEGRDPSTMPTVYATHGAIAYELRRYEVARASYERAHEILRPRSHRPMQLGVIEGNLALLDLEEGQPEAAAGHADAGLALLEEQLGPGNVLVGWMHALAARAQLELGRPGVALEHAERTMEILEGSKDPNAPDFRSDAALVIARVLDDPAAQVQPASIERWGAGRDARSWGELALTEATAGGRSGELARARAEAWLRGRSDPSQPPP